MARSERKDIFLAPGNEALELGSAPCPAWSLLGTWGHPVSRDLCLCSCEQVSAGMMSITGFFFLCP